MTGVSLLSVLLLSGLGTSAGINYVVKFSSDVHLEKDTQASTGIRLGRYSARRPLSRHQHVSTT